MQYPLQALLELRIAAEKAAEVALTRANAALAEREQEQRRLRLLLAELSQKRRQEIQKRAQSLPTQIGGVLQEQAFLTGLAAAERDATNRAEQHRNTQLEPARVEADAAMQTLLECRREKQALEKHREKLEAEEQLKSARRSEDEASDLANASHHRSRGQ